MKKIMVFMISVFFYIQTDAQKLITKNGIVTFSSHTSFENVEAENRQAVSALDLNGKKIAVSLLLRGFLFQKALMQEHFNENYVESDKFPKATFEGTYNENIPIGKNGSYNVTVRGNLTLHGVTRGISVPANITINGDNIIGKTGFSIHPADYNIQIPALVRDKIASTLKVNALLDFRK